MNRLTTAQMFLYMRRCFLRSQMASYMRRPERSRAAWLSWLRQSAKAYPNGFAQQYLKLITS